MGMAASGRGMSDDSHVPGQQRVVALTGPPGSAGLFSG